MVVGGLTVGSLWCCVAVCCMIFSAAAKFSNGDLADASMPITFYLIVFKRTYDCRKPKWHFQRGERCTNTGGAKSATTALWSTPATKAV